MPAKPMLMPSTGKAASNTHLVFVPVDGRLVFFFCLILIAACVVWLCLLASKGVKFEEDA